MKKLLLLALLPIVTIANPAAKSNVIMPSMFYTAARQETYIGSMNFNEITNDTEKLITAWVQYNICIDGCGCDPHHWRITVNPHSSWHNSWQPGKHCEYLHPGTRYQVKAEAVVDGLDGAKLHSECTAYATVQVN